MRRWWLVGLVFLGLVGGTPRDAAAGLIATAPLEAVVACSSHIAIARFDSGKGFVAEAWLRGTWAEGPLPLGPLPPELRRPMQRGRIAAWGAPESKTGEAVAAYLLCMESVHGQLHLTGYRRRRGLSGSHAAVRVFTSTGQVFGFFQMINPGGPVPVLHRTMDRPAFRQHVEALIAKHPYEPPEHPVRLPPLPPEESAKLLEIVDGRVDLYQGDWHTTYGGWFGDAPGTAGIEALAEALAAHARETDSPAAALHALDTITLLAKKTRDGFPHQPAVRRIARSLVPHVDVALARTWVLDEIEHGEYGSDFVLLADLARALGPETYEQALASLEGWVERQDWNKGVGAYWALRELGERRRAEAATERRTMREAAEAAAKAAQEAEDAGR